MRDYAREVAEKYGIPGDMFVAQIQQESGFRPDAVSSAGAQGIAQFMPATAAEWGVDVNDPYSSLDGAARYMDWLYGQTGSWDGALQAYNGGIGNYEKYGGNIPFEETQNYVSTIMGNAGNNNALRAEPDVAMAPMPMMPQQTSALRAPVNIPVLDLVGALPVMRG